MQLELRASGGHTCTTCGATELLHVPSSNEVLVEDLTRLLEQRNILLEADIVSVFHKKREQAESENRKRLDGLEAELKAMLDDEAQAVADGLEALFGDDISRIRVLKRRWNNEVRFELEKVIERILSKTYLL